MNPSAVELEQIAGNYRGWLKFDGQTAPNAEAKKQLADIEKGARRLLKAYQSANTRALDSLCASGEITGAQVDSELVLIPYFDAVERHAVVGPIAGILNRLSAAAGTAREQIPRWRNMTAQRIAASALRRLFVKHDLKFSATADEHGVTSLAVASLLKVARLAGDSSMTDDSARQWIREAKRETLDRETIDRFPDDGLPTK